MLVAPASSAFCEASWMTGPSITGSLNGMPISIASAPAATAARSACCQPGRPPVMYGTSSLRPAARESRNDCSMRPNATALT